MNENFEIANTIPKKVIEYNSQNYDITFFINDKEVLALKENGDIFVQGRLAENDKEVVEGMRKFIQLSMSNQPF